jgi:ribonucleotide monophosphatase NagD (HAD superfamily)
MIGDGIRGDILGAQRTGMAAALVRTGKFRAIHLEGEQQPDFVLDSIAQLPDRWSELVDRLELGEHGN